MVREGAGPRRSDRDARPAAEHDSRRSKRGCSTRERLLRGVTILAVVLAAVTIPIHAFVLRRGPRRPVVRSRRGRASSRPSRA